MILEALIETDAQNSLIPKLVKGLLGHKKKKWGGTSESCFILLALDKYFRTFEANEPDFVSKAWLGGIFAGNHEFKGRRTTDQKTILVPTKYLLEKASS